MKHLNEDRVKRAWEGKGMAWLHTDTRNPTWDVLKNRMSSVERDWSWFWDSHHLWTTFITNCTGLTQPPKATKHCPETQTVMQSSYRWAKQVKGLGSCATSCLSYSKKHSSIRTAKTGPAFSAGVWKSSVCWELDAEIPGVLMNVQLWGRCTW